MAKFILSKNKVMEKYEEMKEISDNVAYSYKTNPNVGRVLFDSDSMFGINSYNNYEEVSKEISKNRILYFLQGESKEKIVNLVNNLNWFVVDNENDLKKLLDISKKEKKEINLFIRIKIKEHTVYTGKYFVYGIAWNKANKIISDLDNKFINKLGVHFHRKTQNIGEWYLKDDIEDALSKETLDKIDLLNIGGGVPSNYINSKPKLKYIFKKIKELKKFLNNKDIKLITEPGRYISAPSVRLKAKILNIYDGNVIIDCSIFNAYMDTYLMHMRLPVKGEVEKGKFKYLIKGCSPDSLDIFRYKVNFNEKLNVGENLVLKNAGAYNFHTNFGNLDKIKTEIVDKF